MFKRLDVVVAILFIHSGITEAELSCQTETEDVQTIRLSLLKFKHEENSHVAEITEYSPQAPD